MFFDSITFDVNDNDYDKQLYNMADAFMLGNSFKDEYKGYKNYSVSYLNSTSDKGSLLLKIYEVDFAINDLSLYLDLHPEDQELYEYFRDCTKKLEKLVNMYESNYGPLELCDSDYENYEWVSSKWPFEGVKF